MTIEKYDLHELPETAAWRHRGLRDGFEVADFASNPADGTTRIWGSSVAVEGSASYAVSYRVIVDEQWATREATVQTQIRDATWSTDFARDENGTWFVDGEVRPDLAACVDIDLEASVVTNTIPVHRLWAEPGSHEVRAVYVRRVPGARSPNRLSRGSVSAAFSNLSRVEIICGRNRVAEPRTASCRMICVSDGLVNLLD